jgi:tripartite-type tricarboxylate transporter receptor subunit TctC
MNTSRRTVLRLAGAALGSLARAHAARAQTYPARPVRWIVPFPAGGPSDILARLIGQALSERLGQPFVIENRPGVSGNVCTQAVVSAAPDGHTLLFVAATNAINATLYENLGFNFIRDITAIASIARGALIIANRMRSVSQVSS